MGNILKLNFNIYILSNAISFLLYIYSESIFIEKQKKHIYLLNQEKCPTCKIMNNIKSYKNRWTSEWNLYFCFIKPRHPAYIFNERISLQIT